MTMKERIHFYFNLKIVTIVLLLASMGGGIRPVPAAAAGLGSNEALARLERLDLETAARLAVAGNPSLAAAAERVRQAKARLAQARSPWFPRLDASAGGTRVDLSENDYQSALAQARYFNPNASVDDPLDTYTAGLTATWVLFNGFEREFNQAAARHGLGESQASRSDVRRLLLSGVVAAFYSGQLAAQNLAIAQADKAFYGRQLTEAEARYRAGTGALSDILSFKIRLNAAEADLITARHSEAVAGHALALSLIHISEPTRPRRQSRMPSSA